MRSKISSMSSQMYKSVGLSAAAVAVLLSAGGAIAQTTTTPPDVVVDTNSPTSTTSTSTNGVRFTCESRNGQHTVMYQPESQPNQSFAWATPSAMGGGWSPKARCEEISRRLEAYRPDGLVEMRTAVENRLNTICVTTDRVPGCRIVLTIPPGQDPEITRDRVFQNLTVADSGQSTIGVNTFVGGRGGGTLNGLFNRGGSTSVRRNRGIYLKPFLDARDGGTGTQLKKPAATRSNGSILNPRIFR